MTTPQITLAGAADLGELLVLMRGYCDFYEVAPSDEDLRALAQTLIDHPETSGIQLLARGSDGAAIGFATIYWSYSTLAAGPIGVMNDLYVDPAARSGGVGTALIRACEAQCAAHGITVLEWETAPENHRAQSVYDRLGAERSTWLTYTLAVTPR